MKVFIIVLAVLIVLFCAACAGIAWYIAHGRRQTMQGSWDWEQEHVRDAKELTREMFTDYIVKGSKGEQIHTSYRDRAFKQIRDPCSRLHRQQIRDDQIRGALPQARLQLCAVRRERAR